MEFTRSNHALWKINYYYKLLHVCPISFKQCQQHPSHLISSHLSALQSDPVCCGCDQSEQSRSHSSFWLVTAAANWVTSQCTQFRSF